MPTRLRILTCTLLIVSQFTCFYEQVAAAQVRRPRRPPETETNMRDERIEAFASLVWEGVHTYSYVARATTPGVFVVPPPKAEEMYHPETLGGGGTDKVIVQ
jgi:uncharacterized protein YfaS (alpha-2-macroglobulin family)